MTRRHPTQAEAIVDCWNQLAAERLGRRELEVVSSKLREQFGNAAPSPAAIARTLADRGIPLSHPDLLDTDTRWREQRMLEIVPADLDEIEAAFLTIENLRLSTSHLKADDVEPLRFQVRQIQQELELFAKSEIGSARRKSVAGELAAWLNVWLQTPAIFDDWLALRKDSPEFRQKFS